MQNLKRKEWYHTSFSLLLEINIPDIQLLPLDHVTLFDVIKQSESELTNIDFERSIEQSRLYANGKLDSFVLL